MLGTHPAIDMPQSTEYAKEMRKWEAYPTKYGPPGRPYQYAEYPKRIYKAAYEPGKGTVVAEAITVHDADEERRMLSRGFSSTIQAAFDAVRAEQAEHGQLAAERAHAVRHGKHGEGAVREIEAAEAAHGARHLPDVPEAPVRRRRASSGVEGVR